MAGAIGSEKRRQRLVLITTILGSAVVLLDGTIVNLALPKIGIHLHVGFSGLQWISDGYLLALSSLILLGGSLGDIFGRKRIYMVGLVGFGIFSILCALSQNGIELILARILQGVFGALLVPGALSLINTNFHPEDKGKAIGQWTSWLSVATVAGPLLGGVILDITSWRWIFLVNIPLIIVCLSLAQASVNESQDEEPRQVDVGGAVLTVIALGGITFGLIQGPVEHWSLLPILSLLVGLIATTSFVGYERRKRDPMVKLSLFSSRNFSGSNFMTFAMYGALSGLTFSLVIFLQTHMHYSSLKAGLSLLPVSIIMFLFAGRVGKLSSVYGARIFMTIGPIIASFGMLYFFFLYPGESYIAGVLPAALLFSVGLVSTVAPLTTTVMTSVPEHESGIASGINNAVARGAGVIVIAVLGLLGTAHVFRFSMALCASLAFIAGVISFVVLEKTPSHLPQKS